MKSLVAAILILTVLAGFLPAPVMPTLSPEQPPSAQLKASIQRGKTIYMNRCLACHQIDGGGVPHLNPPLDAASTVLGKDKTKLIRIVLKGMSDRIEIDGEYYSNSMTANPDLSNVQVADVLNYTRNSWTNKAPIITPADVKLVRTKLK